MLFWGKTDLSGKTMTKITAEQCRAAMGLLDWTVKDLMREADVDKKTVQKLRRGGSLSRKPSERIFSTLVNMGVVFIDGVDGETLPTAALKTGFEPRYATGDTRALSGKDRDDLIVHWKTRRELWDDLSGDGRGELLERMGLGDEGELFGDLPEQQPGVGRS
jgi:hypothetical protein